MSVAMLERILDKVSREAQLLGMQMYHYNEPLLLNHMPRSDYGERRQQTEIQKFTI